MKIYLTGTLGIVSREKQLIKYYKQRLLSFWDIQKNQFAVRESFNIIKNENILRGNRISQHK